MRLQLILVMMKAVENFHVRDGCCYQTNHYNDIAKPDSYTVIHKGRCRTRIEETIQKMIRSKYVRFKVTTCLYLSPKIRARSLSTLTAVIVKRETDANIKPATKCVISIKRQKFQYSLTKDSQYITAECSEIRPTQRSVVARQRYRNLDGE